MLFLIWRQNTKKRGNALLMLICRNLLISNKLKDGHIKAMINCINES